MPETVEVTADLEVCDVSIIEVVDIKPDDLIVLTHSGNMSIVAYQRLVTALSDALGGAKVVVLEDGMEITAILRRG